MSRPAFRLQRCQKLDDLGQVTQPLCASMSMSVSIILCRKKSIPPGTQLVLK